MTRLASTKEMQAHCDEFNARHKPGDIITVRRVRGEPETYQRTIGSGMAYILGGHTAVVHVTDGGGCWALAHVVENPGRWAGLDAALAEVAKPL